MAHDGHGLREEGNGVPEMAGPLLGDRPARARPALDTLLVCTKIPTGSVSRLLLRAFNSRLTGEFAGTHLGIGQSRKTPHLFSSSRGPSRSRRPMLMPMYAWHGCLPMHRQAAEIQPDDDGANQAG